jgi:hypothetical protein
MRNLEEFKKKLTSYLRSDKTLEELIQMRETLPMFISTVDGDDLYKLIETEINESITEKLTLIQK